MRTNLLTQSAKNDGFASVLREAVEGMKTGESCNPLSAGGLQEVVSETALYNKYISALCEGMSADSAEQFRSLAENTRASILAESTLSAIQPVSALNFAIQRKAWPRIGVKDAIPTQAIKVPEITVNHLIPYIVDPVSGVKKELPAGLRGASAAATSQTKVVTTVFSVPAVATDIMPSGAPVSGGYTLDPALSITAVNMSVRDAGGINAMTVKVPVYDGKTIREVGDGKGSFRFTVTGEHTDGTEHTDTVFGYVDYALGTISAVQMSSTANKVTGLFINGKIDSTSNKRSTVVGFSNKTTRITVGSGEHFSAELPLEWLQDNLAMYNIDGTLTVVDIMTEVLSQKVDIEGIEFLQESYDKFAAENPLVSFARTFDVHPGGNYAHSPSEWINELRRVVDNLASTMRNTTNLNSGTFVIMGNPIDMDLLPNAQWQFTAGDERDGVAVEYALGSMKGANRYSLFSSQNVDRGTIWVFFIPSQEMHKSYQYFPYTFNVMKTSEGFINSGNANVPGVMMTKRHKFHEFRGVIGKVTITNNDGTSPA